MRSSVALALLASTVLLSFPASGQVPLRPLVRAVGPVSHPARRALRGPQATGVPVLARATEDEASRAGLTMVAPGLAGGVLDDDALGAALEGPLGRRLSWTPPRHTLLDQAADWVGVRAFRQQTGESGAGACVGVVDTGIDLTHPDFLDADGKTRVAWAIDFSRGPAGLHPELEERYGCTRSSSRCAIFARGDLQARLSTPDDDEPVDVYGHGTHVASLAAANGASSAGRFQGVAPEATLLIARVTRFGGGSILDPDVLVATRFLFERAEELALPVVVNLSLGSDFGGHDGTSELERGLASFVGDDHPGRAIVIAAGNSAGLFIGTGTGLREPLGVHTEVHVPSGSDVTVPLLLPRSGGLAGDAYVWIGVEAGDTLAVGARVPGVDELAPLTEGDGRTVQLGDVTFTILNGESPTSLDGPDAASPGAVVVVSGATSTLTPVELVLRGRATARLWVQSEGGFAPGGISIGALFPAASKEGTINVPASHPELIAVGATVNRVTWNDRAGSPVDVRRLGFIPDEAPLDSTAYYSSAGPTRTGALKPDIAAPGSYLVGAMARAADPELGGVRGIFAGGLPCENDENCLVVDDTHGVSTGTSMAAPIVAGAVALMLARDPTLTERRIRDLLQAGARRPSGAVLDTTQVGAGVMNVQRSLAVLSRAGLSSGPTDGRQSWVSLAATFLRPGGPATVALVHLRDAGGDPVDAAAADLTIRLAGREVPPVRVTPGLIALELSAPAGAVGSLRLEVVHDGAVVVDESVPVGVDRHAVNGTIRARGGCAVARPGRSGSGWMTLTLLVGVALRWRRRGSRQSVRVT